VEEHRYGVAYRRLTTNYEVFVQRISGDGRLIWPNGDPGGPPTQASLTPGGGADEPEIVYRPDANGDDAPGDRWIVGYNSSANDEIHLSAVEADTNNAVVDRQVSVMPAAASSLHGQWISYAESEAARTGTPRSPVPRWRASQRRSKWT
jgi:hypothetical protein